ncbi:MAG: hypothetical protein IJU28_08635 [Clostridia bacterium]|nr:hypothetical protein [Clostridia bacterium]
MICKPKPTPDVGRSFGNTTLRPSTVAAAISRQRFPVGGLGYVAAGCRRYEMLIWKSKPTPDVGRYYRKYDPDAHRPVAAAISRHNHLLSQPAVRPPSLFPSSFPFHAQRFLFLSYFFFPDAFIFSLN